MRFQFQPQTELGTCPISDIEFKISSRHELTPILMALQHVYLNFQDKLNEILALIQESMGVPKHSKSGRIGMNCWEILVLASVRLGCNMNFDQLEDLATNHKKLRQIMMISSWDDKGFSRSSIHDNLYMLTPETIKKIGDIILGIGHAQCNEPLSRVRGDSFVIKKNTHYPTDTNILYDGCRKALELSEKIATQFNIPGLRKHNYLKKEIKKVLRKITKVASSRSKDRDAKLRCLYITMIEKALFAKGKAVATLSSLKQKASSGEVVISTKWEKDRSELHYFIAGIDYVIDLAKRRMFNGETISNPEKVFSLFEPDTELINRGKSPNPIEFGHRVLVVQDSAGFIIHHSVLGQGFTDEKVVFDVMNDLQYKHDGQIRAASFDKGFWSPYNFSNLSDIIDLVVLPKKGNHKEEDKARESSEEFGEVRKWHSGIESAIGALQAGNGLKVCRDKGVTGYSRYLSMGVLGRNLHTLGNILLKKEREKRKKDDVLMSLVMAA